MICKTIVFFTVLHTLANAGVVATVKVLQGPGSRTSLYGPDGSTLQSDAPGGTLVTGNDGPAGLVAAGPAVLPGSREIIVGGGPTGKIVTSYRFAGPAVVPAVAPGAAVLAGPSAIATPPVALQVPLGNFGTIAGLHLH